MQIETKVRSRVSKKGEPEVVLDVIFLPRGSGNRAKVRRLGEEFRKHEVVGPYVKRVVCGATRLTVSMRAGFGLMGAIMELSRQAKEKQDVPGQLPLFGAGLAT